MPQKSYHYFILAALFVGLLPGRLSYGEQGSAGSHAREGTNKKRYTLTDEEIKETHRLAQERIDQVSAVQDRWIKQAEEHKAKTRQFMEEYRSIMASQDTQNWNKLDDGVVKQIKDKVSELLREKPDDLSIMGGSKGALFPSGSEEAGNRNMMVRSKKDLFYLNESGKTIRVFTDGKTIVDGFFGKDKLPLVLYTGQDGKPQASVNGETWKAKRIILVRGNRDYELTSPDGSRKISIMIDFNKKLRVFDGDEENKSSLLNLGKS